LASICELDLKSGEHDLASDSELVSFIYSKRIGKNQFDHSCDRRRQGQAWKAKALSGFASKLDKLIYAEVDRMLKLGVIDESESACSSPLEIVQNQENFGCAWTVGK